MGPISPFLVTQATKGLSAYRTGQQERQQQDLQNAMTQYRIQQEMKKQAIADELAQSHAGLYRAQTDKARQPTPGAHVASQEGDLYVQNPDGSFSKAKINQPETPQAPAQTGGDVGQGLDASKEAAISQGVVPQTQGAAPGGAPKFGPRPPQPPRPTGPLLGSPEYLRAQEELAKMRSRYAPPVQPQIVMGVNPDTKQQEVFRVPKAGGPAEKVEGIAPNPTQQGGGLGTAALRGKVAENRALAKQIEMAIEDVKSNPKAFGFRRMVGDKANQMIDPGGVAARQRVSAIGNQRLHLLSGAAVTLNEARRFQPSLPDVGSQSDAIITKLKGLLNQVNIETNEMEKVGGAAVQPQGGGRGGATATSASSGGKTITVNGKTFKVPDE